MNYGRIALAALAATFVYYLYGFLVEGLLIRKDFAPYAVVYRSADRVMGYMPLGFACSLIAIFVVAIMYAKGSAGGLGFTQSVQFGLMVGIFVMCAFVGANYVILNIGGRLALELAVSALVQWMIVCVVIGLIYKPAATVH
ncbi:MAG TPA: hypothetical protein VEW69_01785 [Alphaproteobacteria bacterium]|nr:hypothetical protein [Alphaproteobacteria bacterium]